MNLDTSAAVPALLVRKYGGSSLASTERLRTVAADLADLRRRGIDLVVVVSAMGQTTDELGRLAAAVSDRPSRRELDMLLSVGERITMSLLSMALCDLGCPAVSYTGSQCGLITEGDHNAARIVEVRCDRVRESLAAGQIVVVAGFQGVSRDREITTLGRGGSDATAVALAAALSAERCEILKDVDGVYTADPHVVRDALRHEALSYEQMEAIAGAGCGVIHAAAVAYARAHGVPLFVGSSFREGPGTIIDGRAEAGVVPCAETPHLLSIVVDRNVRRFAADVDAPETSPADIRLAFTPGIDLSELPARTAELLAGHGCAAIEILVLDGIMHVLIDPARVADALPVLHDALMEADDRPIAGP